MSDYPSLQTLLELFEYNPETGTLIIKHSGKIVEKDAYQVYIIGKRLAIPRLVYYLFYHDDPKDRVYFLDGDRTNLKINNLILQTKIIPYREDKPFLEVRNNQLFIISPVKEDKFLLNEDNIPSFSFQNKEIIRWTDYVRHHRELQKNIQRTN